MNCIIDCETLTCKICGKPVRQGCDIKRNCVPSSNIPQPKNKINMVGTELKKLLSKIGIQSKKGCGCSDRARHIDYMESIEPGWAEKNIEEIVDWMQEEAKKRKLPFVRAGAKVLVKLAIRRAKK